jgi:hypothetical protein
MHELCYSSNPEVVECYCALMSHMPDVSKDSHIFLQAIPNLASHIWFRKNVNVSKEVLAVIVASMAAKVGLVGDFTNKSCRSTSISRMIANGVPEDVIITITGHKNPKSLKRYDRTSIVRHISAQQASRQHAKMSYEDLLHCNMDYWRKKNGLNRTPLSSRSGLGIEGSGIQLDFSQFFYCVASDVKNCDMVIDRNVCLSPLRESGCACSGLGGGLFSSSSRIVPSPRSDPIGHLDNCIFNSSDHLLSCPADPVYHHWDLVDKHFPISSPLQSDRSIIEVDSPEREQAVIESPNQSVSGSRLSRAERNLLTAQLKRLQSTHSFGPSKPVIQPMSQLFSLVRVSLLFN